MDSQLWFIAEMIADATAAIAATIAMISARHARREFDRAISLASEAEAAAAEAAKLAERAMSLASLASSNVFSSRSACSFAPYGGYEEIDIDTSNVKVRGCALAQSQRSEAERT